MGDDAASIESVNQNDVQNYMTTIELAKTGKQEEVGQTPKMDTP
jgi:hypothetical protein